MANKVILNKVFPNAAYMTQNADNIGHETINLFKANDGYYIHLNASGTYNGTEPVDVLNVSYVGTGLYQVVSKAVNCKVLDGAQIIGSDKGKVRYNKQADKIFYGYYDAAKTKEIPVCKYFEDNVTMQGQEEKDLFATFKCDGIYEAKERIYIAVGRGKQYSGITNLYTLKDKKEWRSSCRIINIAGTDLIDLQSVVSQNDLWQTEPLPSFEERYEELKKKSEKGEENYFTFLGVEKQELQYSNALIKILKFKPEFIPELLYELSKKDCKNNKFDILREEKSIDILLWDLDREIGKIFIIENKIDASITLSDYGMTIEKQIEKWFNKIEKIGENDKRTDEQDRIFKRIERIVDEGLKNRGKKASQLSKYYIIAVYWAVRAGWDDAKIEEDIYCYFLCPEYHRFNYKVLGSGKLDSNFAFADKYTLVTYLNVYEVLKKFSLTGLSDHQKFLYNDFLSAIFMLAKERDDSMELKMIRLFIERYEKIKRGN